MKKNDIFNGKYEDNFVNFLNQVKDEINIPSFPSIVYHESNPPIDPLILIGTNHRIKKPDKIIQEIAYVLQNLEKWSKVTKSGIMIWLYCTDNKTLHHVVLTINDGKATPRIYMGYGQEKYNNSIFWFWTYPFFYDYVE